MAWAFILKGGLAMVMAGCFYQRWSSVPRLLQCAVTQCNNRNNYKSQSKPRFYKYLISNCAITRVNTRDTLLMWDCKRGGMSVGEDFYTAICKIRFYYPPEVRRGQYWGLGIFLMQPFLLSRYEISHYICININIVH